MSNVLLSSGLVRGTKAGGLARLLVGLVLLGSALMMFAAPSALAAYEITGTFAGDGPGVSGSGSADGQLSDPGQADVLSSTGALYVADTANNRVQVSTPTPSGAAYSFQAAVSSPTGLAIDQSDGSVYVATATGISKLNADLTPAAGWVDPAIAGSLTLAVDPTDGDLLVADRDASLIRRFASNGTVGTTFAAARPLDVAVDSTGGLLVVTSTGDIQTCATSAVERFDASGLPGLPFPAVWAPGSVSVDPDDDSVIVAKRVNTYNCIEVGTAELPEVAIFSNAGVAGPVLALQARYADIPGLAVAGAGSSRIYAVTKSPFDDSFGPTGVTAIRDLSRPAPVIAAASAITSASAQGNGSVNPGGHQTSAHFEYRRAGIGADWTSLPDQDVGAGTAPIDISDQLANLVPGRPYAVRIVATSDDGTVTSTIAAFATASEAPVVQTRSVSDLTSTSARLRGTVDPRGAATTYSFQFGTTTAYGSQIPLTPQGTDPSGLSAVSQLVTGLQPGMTYHYRIVAVNANGMVNGDDRAFQALAVDPASRGYEKVSPGQKGSQDVFIERPVNDPSYSVIAADDGSRVGYLARGIFGDPASGGLLNDYSARRTPSGWISQSYALKDNRLGGHRDAGAVFGWSDNLERGVWSISASDPSIAPNETPDSTNLYRVDTADKQFVTATPDPGVGLGGSGGVTYRGGSGDLATVVYQSAVPRTPGAPGAGVQSLYAWHDDQPLRVDLVSLLPDPDGAGPLTEQPALGGADLAGPNAVSDDGSRIYFVANDGRLYLRVGNAKTVEVSASQKTIADASQPVTYGTASADGATAFFTTTEQLVDEDTDAVTDLYRYSVATGHLTRIARGVNAQGIVGASDDGSYVYYQTGFELRIWHGGEVHDIADTHGLVDKATLRVSADGTGIVYLADGQVHVYDADDDELQCASCRDDGGPAGSAALPDAYLVSDGYTKIGSQHSITRDGDRVFFTSPDPLVPGDVNGKNDAYEFYDGQPHLLSSGENSSNSYFVDASADGSDAFFVTREQLVASDGDDNFDLYDARVGGGFDETAAGPPCSGEGCQGAAAAVSSPPLIGSVSFAGGGDGPSRGVTVRRKVAVSRSSVSGAAATVRVKVPGKGRVVASGAAVTRSSRSVTRAGTYTVRVVLTASAKRTLARRKILRTKVKIAFVPVSGGPLSASVSLSFKATAKKAGR